MEPNLKGIQAYVALIHSNMDENDVIEEEASLFMRNCEISSTQRDKVKNHCTTTFHINHSFPYYTSEKNLKHYIIPSGCSGIECVHNKELSGILLIRFKPQISLIFTSFLMVTVFWSSTNEVTRGQHHKGAAHYPSMIGILFFTSVIGIYVLQSGQRVKNLKLPQQLQVLCVLLVRLLCLL